MSGLLDSTRRKNLCSTRGLPSRYRTRRPPSITSTKVETILFVRTISPATESIASTIFRSPNESAAQSKRTDSSVVLLVGLIPRLATSASSPSACSTNNRTVTSRSERPSNRTRPITSTVFPRKTLSGVVKLTTDASLACAAPRDWPYVIAQSGTPRSPKRRDSA